jgi:hypothetical protein
MMTNMLGAAIESNKTHIRVEIRKQVRKTLIYFNSN